MRNKNTNIKNSNLQTGFTPRHFFGIDENISNLHSSINNGNKRKSLQNGEGFTLIEILVVVAIIALLSSIALIALMSARQKSRDVKRLSDMTQMNTGLELYFSKSAGYPSVTNGFPQGLIPTFMSQISYAPIPADGACDSQVHNNDLCTQSDPACTGLSQNTYYYVPSGTAYVNNGVTVYPDYSYYFCLGSETGNFAPGPHILTPKGVR